MTRNKLYKSLIMCVMVLKELMENLDVSKLFYNSRDVAENFVDMTCTSRRG